MSRPLGSNADEWHLFLSEHLDNYNCAGNMGLTYMAVQIAEAIDTAQNSHAGLLAAAKMVVEAADDPDSASGDIALSIENLHAAITKAEKSAPPEPPK